MHSCDILCESEELVAQDLLIDRQISPVDVEKGNDEESVLSLPRCQTPEIPVGISTPSTSRCNNATRHYESCMSRCKCKPRCGFKNSQELAVSFAMMPESARVSAVRSILMALTAPAQWQNELIKSDIQAAQLRKKRRRTAQGAAHTTTKFVMRVVVLCADAFSAIVQLHPRTTRAYSKEIGESIDLTIHETQENKRREGCLSIQSLIAIRFLQHYSQLNAMACPTERGSTEETPLLLLPSSVTKRNIHVEYCFQWENIMTGYVETSGYSAKRPTAPLERAGFCKAWNKYLPSLRIMKSGSDFCDVCTKLGNFISTVGDENTRDALLETRSKHREHASSEFAFYKDVKMTSSVDTQSLHFVFDFAEKVLVPHLLRQPGQLHFTTGLKFDIFGVHVSNIGKTKVFGLPEGHWPGGKTASEVSSMVDYAIKTTKMPFPLASTLTFHADNCAGQNKNQFILYYLACWCGIMGSGRNRYWCRALSSPRWRPSG